MKDYQLPLGRAGQRVMLLAMVLLIARCGAQPFPNSQPGGDKAARGQVVHLQGDPTTIYLVKEGRKSQILDPTWVLRNGYQWEDVRALSGADLAAMPSSADILEDDSVPRNHQLVRSSRDGKIYVLSGGEKRWLLNPDWIAANGYSWQELRIVSGSDLDLVPSGGPIGSSITEGSERDVRIRQTVGTLMLLLAGVMLLSVASGRWKHRVPFFDGPTSKLLSSRWLWLTIFAVLLVVRMPSLFTHPRFWAEEGTVWFQYAIDHTASKTLTYMFPDSGYFILLPNIGAMCAALVARIGSVEYAPLATTVIATVVQLLCFVIILFGGSPLFAPLWRGVCACAIVMFAPVESSEIWLNTINSMSYLGLIALLLLLCEADTWSRLWKWSSRCMLVICGLSGPYSVFLFPGFVFYLWLHKNRERTIQVVLLSVCLATQAGLVITNRFTGRLPAARISHFSLATAAVNIVHLHILAPILGDPMTTVAGRSSGLMAAWDYSGSFPRRAGHDILLAAWVSLLIGLTTLLFLSRWDRAGPDRSLALMFVLVATGTAVGSLYSIPGGRYAFLPTIIFLFLLVSNLDAGSATRFFIVSVAVCLYLSNGLLRFRDFGEWNGTPPQWADEVRLWRNDHRHLLRVWPSFWTSTVDLGSLVNGPANVSQPLPVSVRPSSGTGGRGTFRLVYGEPGGFKHLSRVHLLFNSDLRGTGSCWIYYQPPDDTLWLVNDTQTANLGPLRPGRAGEIENSQCTLKGADTSVRGIGGSIEVNVEIVFKDGFAGAKELYLNAQSAPGTSNWKEMGTWTVTPSRR